MTVQEISCRPGRTARACCLALTLAALACTPTRQEIPVETASAGSSLDTIAERYVKLVLAVGVHDGDYVDAYYGPGEWREQAASAALGLDQIRDRAQALLETARSVAPVTRSVSVGER